MRLDSVSGDIEGTILGNYADYRIEYDTISGDVELNGAEGSASATREIWLNTVSGDIDLNFIQSFTAVSYTHLDVYKRQRLWLVRLMEEGLSASWIVAIWLR